MMNDWPFICWVALASLLSFAAVASSEVIREAGRCVAFGFSESQDGYNNKVNNTLAVPIDSAFHEGLENLANICPSLAEEKALCCDIKQFKEMAGRFRQAAPILYRCQACYQNFRELFCQYTCSPDQSLFKEILQEVVNDQNGNTVKATYFHVAADYAKGLLDSCKDIQLGSTGKKLFKSIFPGVISGFDWLNFLGRDFDHGGYSAEWIRFPVDSNLGTIIPLNSTPKRTLVTQCSTSDISLSCSCSDCDSSCPNEDAMSLNAAQQPNPGRDHLLNLFATSIILFTGLILTALILSAYPRRNSDMGVNQNRYTSIAPRISKAAFRFVGKLVGRHPKLTILHCVALVVICAYIGIPKLELLQDPVQLWTSPSSESYVNMRQSQSLFGNPFRVEQVILNRKDGSPMFESASTKSLLFRLYSLRERLLSISVITNDSSVSYNELCYRLSPNQPCLVQSVLGFWGSEPIANETSARDAYDHFQYCTSNNFDPLCFDESGMPTMSEVILGGLRHNESSYESATATIFTLLLNGATGQKSSDILTSWERSFISEMRLIASQEFPDFSVSFSSEQSLQTELNAQVYASAVSIGLSYLLMCIYITFALGECFPLRQLWNSTRFTLAIAAIFTVIMSVTLAVAFCAMLGVKFTLIIGEVIPFIVLAIGVDNVFVIFKAFRRQPENLPSSDKLSEALCEVGPSICLASVCESLAFLLGALTSMPAVRSFAAYGSLSVIVNLCLQLTCFCAFIVLDDARVQSGRWDCLPCISIRSNSAETPTYEPVGIIMKRTLVPVIVHRICKRIIVLTFLIAAFLCLILISSHLELGMDPKIALPSDSYLQDYLQDVTSLLRVGPPAYYITEADFSSVDVQNSLCSLPQCSKESLGEIVTLAAKSPDITYLQTGAVNWIDDYLQWLSPPFLHISSSSCCRRNINTGAFCLPSELDDNCMPCISDSGYDIHGHLMINVTSGRPTSDAFNRFLPEFLQSNCSALCPFCSTPHYQNLKIVSEKDGSVKVAASRFMAYHTVLQTQSEFISALKSSRSVASKISEATGLHLFPDSLFYVFFEQYLTIEDVAAMAIGAALLAVTVACLALLADAVMALAIGGTIAFIVIDVLGIMASSGIMLNAVSVVNLVTCVGLSVEFCLPIVYHYKISSQPSVHLRISECVSETGSCIFKGIFLTKIVGLFVLYLSATEMIRTYYAHMYFLICVIGAAHGLIFLPCLMCLIEEMRTVSHTQSISEPLLADEGVPKN